MYYMQFPIHHVEAKSAIRRARRFVDSLPKVHLTRGKCNGREKKEYVIFATKSSISVEQRQISFNEDKTKASGWIWQMSKFLVFSRDIFNAVTLVKQKLAINEDHRSSSPEKLFTTSYRETMWEHARVPMPEMETQREWTNLQLLQSPLGSVPELVTSAMRRLWFRHRFRSQESHPYRSKSSCKYSLISPARSFTPLVKCRCSSTGSLMTRFYGELTRYDNRPNPF